MKNSHPKTTSRQLDLPIRMELVVSLSESNKRELINAIAELVIKYAGHQIEEEVKRHERQDND